MLEFRIWNLERIVARRGLIYFKSELFRGDRRGLLKTISLVTAPMGNNERLKNINSLGATLTIKQITFFLIIVFEEIILLCKRIKGKF